MDAYRFFLWLHWIALVGATGLALFWLLMPTALARFHPPERARELFLLAHRARWPHVGVPERLRLPLPLLTLLATLAVAVTGILPSGTAPVDALYAAKLAVVLVLLIVQAAFVLRPHVALARLQLPLALLALWLSVLWVR